MNDRQGNTTSHHCPKLDQEPYHGLATIALEGSRWIFWLRCLACEDCVYDGQATEIGELIFEFRSEIFFCPQCGASLNDSSSIHRSSNDLSQRNSAPEIHQCGRLEEHNSNSSIIDRTFVTIKKGRHGYWMLEKFSIKNANDAEHVFEAGFSLSYCPFCGAEFHNT